MLALSRNGDGQSLQASAGDSCAARPPQREPLGPQMMVPSPEGLEGKATESMTQVAAYPTVVDSGAGRTKGASGARKALTA